jgi:hypothetical protein
VDKKKGGNDRKPKRVIQSHEAGTDTEPGGDALSFDVPSGEWAGYAAKVNASLQQARLVVARRGPMDVARRARLLAVKLETVAEQLERVHRDPESNEELSVASDLLPISTRVNAAWRAFHGLTEDRHRRLALIEAIRLVSEGTLNVTPAPGSTAHLRTGAELARNLYSREFPDMAAKLDIQKLEVALQAWSNPRGRPRRGRASTPKWQAIKEAAMSAGSEATSPDSIQREWEKYGHEVQSENPPA